MCNTILVYSGGGQTETDVLTSEEIQERSTTPVQSEQMEEADGGKKSKNQLVMVSDVKDVGHMLH